MDDEKNKFKNVKIVIFLKNVGLVHFRYTFKLTQQLQFSFGEPFFFSLTSLFFFFLDLFIHLSFPLLFGFILIPVFTFFLDTGRVFPPYINMDLDFEIDGVCERIKTFYSSQKDLPKRRVVTLQFPDGLMAYATTIADKIKSELTVCSLSSHYLFNLFIFPLLFYLYVLLNTGTPFKRRCGCRASYLRRGCVWRMLCGRCSEPFCWSAGCGALWAF